MADRINIYTDGACQDNPGPGGWGAIVEQDGESRELSGREEQDHQQPDGDYGRHQGPGGYP